MPLKRQKPSTSVPARASVAVDTYWVLADKVQDLQQRSMKEQNFSYFHAFPDLAGFRRQYFDFIRRSLCQQGQTSRFSIQPLFELTQFTVPRVGSQCDSCFQRLSEDDYDQNVDCIINQLAVLAQPSQASPDRFEISESFSNFETERPREKKPESLLFNIEENSSFDIVKPLGQETIERNDAKAHKGVETSSGSDSADDNAFFEVTPLAHNRTQCQVIDTLKGLEGLCRRNCSDVSSDNDALMDGILCRQPMSAKALKPMAQIGFGQQKSTQPSDASVQGENGSADFAAFQFPHLTLQTEADQQHNLALGRGLKSAQSSSRSDAQQRKVKCILKKEK